MGGVELVGELGLAPDHVDGRLEDGAVRRRERLSTTQK
jgi:hypothetical protein